LLHQDGDLFELSVKHLCQNVKSAFYLLRLCHVQHYAMCSIMPCAALCSADKTACK